MGDVDVFGFDDDGGNDVYVNYMHMRRGAVVRSVTLRYRRSLEEEKSCILGYAMDEIRTSLGVGFDEVVVAEAPEVGDSRRHLHHTPPRRQGQAPRGERAQRPP